jgi:hypothetical protein
MVINVPRDKSNKKKMIQWLTDNISKENLRWWFTDPHWRKYIILDITEEEQPLLTLFLLRWTSVE